MARIRIVTLAPYHWLQHNFSLVKGENVLDLAAVPEAAKKYIASMVKAGAFKLIDEDGDVIDVPPRAPAPCAKCAALKGARPCSVECYVASGYKAADYEHLYGEHAEGAPAAAESAAPVAASQDDAPPHAEEPAAEHGDAAPEAVDADGKKAKRRR